jgi:hypothetical protein
MHNHHTIQPMNSFAAVLVGLAVAVAGGVATFAAGGGLIAAAGAYCLGGSAAMAGVGAITVVRPIRPRLRRAVARLPRAAATFSH